MATGSLEAHDELLALAQERCLGAGQPGAGHTSKMTSGKAAQGTPRLGRLLTEATGNHMVATESRTKGH